MRPPLSATPPIGHVLSRKFLPTPCTETPEDWKNLTDHSIQILSFENSEICIDGNASVGRSSTDGPDELSKVYEGLFDEINQNPLDQVFASETKADRMMLKAQDRKASQRKQENQFKSSDACMSVSYRCLRSSYSDSDFFRDANRHRLVARSRSLYVRPIEYDDVRMVQPLQPSAHRSKIGSVRRIPSFRETLKSTVNEKPDKLIGSGVNQLSRISNYEIKAEAYTPETKSTTNKVSVLKLLKMGLKSVTKGQDNKFPNVASKFENSFEKSDAKRRRKVRCGSDIGGLSEFLWRHERKEDGVRRKTICMLPETHEEKCGTKEHGGMPVIKELDLLWKGSNDSAHYAGHACGITSLGDTVNSLSAEPIQSMDLSRGQCSRTTSLKLNQCQRKLSFSSADRPGQVRKDIKVIEQDGTECIKQTATIKRPRLGVLVSAKPVHITTIDELEMDLVRDLKRRIEKANRGTRIKTNGSLKPRTGPAYSKRICAQSPRRRGGVNQPDKCMFPASLGSYRTSLKRESVV